MEENSKQEECMAKKPAMKKVKRISNIVRITTRKIPETKLRHGEKEETCVKCGGKVISSFDPNIATHTGTCKKCNILNAYPSKDKKKN